MKGGVTNVSANDQVIWGSNAEMDNTLVIGPTADCKDITKCLVIELPQGSALRQYGNLLDNPGVYGKAIKAYGNFAPVLGANGISGNTGSTAEWQIDGVTVGPNPGGDAVASLFCDFEGYNKQISNLVEAGWTVTKTSGDKNWYLNEFSGNTYAAATAYKGTTGPWDEWLISPAIDLSKSPKKTLTFKCQAAYQSTTSTMKVYVLTSADPNTATKTELTVTLPEIPASGYSSWVDNNEQFNNSVPKTIPDDFVPSHFGGAATVVNGNPFQLRPHQAKAVIRATTQPVLLAHEVGTGKTYTLITTAMEMRRLGTARKPMIVVQNATVGQFVASATPRY